jgi:hypothetical protein
VLHEAAPSYFPAAPMTRRETQYQQAASFLAVSLKEDVRPETLSSGGFSLGYFEKPIELAGRQNRYRGPVTERR